MNRTRDRSNLPLPSGEFQILLALVDGPKHGHAIKLDVRDHTDGRIVMGPGKLYGAIKRLLQRDWIEEIAPPGKAAAQHDERRRYYRITRVGRRMARAEADRMHTLLGIAQSKALIKV